MADGFDKRISGRKRQSPQANKLMVVGIAWYRPESYDRCLALFEDSNKLHSTYAEWLQSAEKVERQLSRDGMQVVRAYIDPVAFPIWCIDRGYLKLDEKARSAYCSEFAKESGNKDF